MQQIVPIDKQTERSAQQAIADKLRQVFVPPCRRVLLVKPPSFGEGQFSIEMVRNRRYYNYPPYGLGVLSTHLQRRGYSVEILDLNMEMLDSAQSDPGEVDSIDRRSQDRLIQTLNRFNPDVVGITCTFTMTHAMMLRVADTVKAHRPALPVVAGGVHVSTSPETVLAEGRGIDLVMLYEGDRAFCDLLDFVNGRVPKEDLAHLAMLVDGRYVSLDQPQLVGQEYYDVAPDYGDLPIGRYRQVGEIGAFRYWLGEQTKAGIVLSNRGCRGRCAFCTVWRLHHKKVRCRTVESVISEIEQLQDRHGVTHITWLDDDLFYDSRRAIRLFDEIVRRRLNITWDATNGVITSAVARCPELIEAAVRSGCIGMYFGIESGSPEILRRMGKPSKVEHALKVGQIMKQYPQVFARGFLIIGFPGETLGQIQDTMALARDMDLDWYTVSLLTPLPATDVYEQMVHDGVIQQTRTEGAQTLEELCRFVGYGYSVRHGEDRRAIERQGLCNARQFVFDPDLDRVPSREELNDLWLIADYKVNYEKILAQDDPLKLRKMQCFLTDVSDRMTADHPLANLFLGIVHRKLGDRDRSQQRMDLSSQLLERSAYWRQFFRASDLYRLFGEQSQGPAKQDAVKGRLRTGQRSPSEGVIC